MTNHLHFLMQVGDEPLSTIMRDIASGYARAFQQKLATTGHLFERRYHAILVDADGYLLELLRYIHLNPVEAGIAANPLAYRWSSHHAYLGAAVDPWVTSEFALRMFADGPARARARYSEFVNRNVATLQCPLDEARGEFGQFLGGDEFIERATTQPVKTRSCPTLESIVTLVCAEAGIDPASLLTASRHESVSRMRARITARALECGAANLSEIARRLECDRKTLRDAMRRHEGLPA